jgi:hypothetical protein
MAWCVVCVFVAFVCVCACVDVSLYPSEFSPVLLPALQPRQPRLALRMAAQHALMLCRKNLALPRSWLPVLLMLPGANGASLRDRRPYNSRIAPLR